MTIILFPNNSHKHLNHYNSKNNNFNQQSNIWSSNWPKEFQSPISKLIYCFIIKPYKINFLIKVTLKRQLRIIPNARLLRADSFIHSTPKIRPTFINISTKRSRLSLLSAQQTTI